MRILEHASQPTQQVVTIGQNQERKQYEHADVLRYGEEFFGGLSAGYHLPNGEDNMTTIQTGNGDNIHKGQNNGKQGRNRPEAMPVPLIGKKAP